MLLQVRTQTCEIAGTPGNACLLGLVGYKSFDYMHEYVGPLDNTLLASNQTSN